MSFRNVSILLAVLAIPFFSACKAEETDDTDVVDTDVVDTDTDM